MNRDHYNGNYRISSGVSYPEDKNVSHKGRSPVFFQNTRISSCNHVSMKNGRPVAIPFKPNYPTYGTGPMPARLRDQIQVPVSNKRDIVDYNMGRTAYADQYRLKHSASAGSFKKPLAKYATNHPRSR